LGANNSGRIDPVMADQRTSSTGLGAGEEQNEDIYSDYKQLMRHKFKNRPMPFTKR